MGHKWALKPLIFDHKACEHVPSKQCTVKDFWQQYKLKVRRRWILLVAQLFLSLNEETWPHNQHQRPQFMSLVKPGLLVYSVSRMRWNQCENQCMAQEGCDGNKSVFQSLFTQTLINSLTLVGLIYNFNSWRGLLAFGMYVGWSSCAHPWNWTWLGLSAAIHCPVFCSNLFGGYWRNLTCTLQDKDKYLGKSDTKLIPFTSSSLGMFFTYSTFHTTCVTRYYVGVDSVE